MGLAQRLGQAALEGLPRPDRGQLRRARRSRPPRSRSSAAPAASRTPRSSSRRRSPTASPRRSRAWRGRARSRSARSRRSVTTRLAWGDGRGPPPVRRRPAHARRLAGPRGRRAGAHRRRRGPLPRLPGDLGSDGAARHGGRGAGMSIVLYSNPASSNAMKVRFLLAELGLEYEREHVPLARPRPDWYLEIYPFGTIPFMRDGDLELGESNAMLRYLANREGRTDLYPAEPAERARVDWALDAWSTQFRGTFFPAEQIALMQTPIDEGGSRAEDADQAELAEAIEAVKPKLDVMERFVASNGTVLGHVHDRRLRVRAGAVALVPAAARRSTRGPRSRCFATPSRPARRSRRWSRSRDDPRRRPGPRPRGLRADAAEVGVAGRREGGRQPRARLRGGLGVLGHVGRRPKRRLGRVRRPGRAAAAARPRHRVALRVRKPRGRVAAGAHLRLVRRAGHGVGGRRRARAQPGRDGLDARARPRPARPWLALDGGVDVRPRRRGRLDPAGDQHVRARARLAARRMELARLAEREHARPPARDRRVPLPLGGLGRRRALLRGRRLRADARRSRTRRRTTTRAS